LSLTLATNPTNHARPTAFLSLPYHSLAVATPQGSAYPETHRMTREETSNNSSGGGDGGPGIGGTKVEAGGGASIGAEIGEKTAVARQRQRQRCRRYRREGGRCSSTSL